MNTSQKPSSFVAEDAVKTLLLYLGEDPTRPGLVDTPKRVVKALKEMLSSYGQDPRDILKTFDSVCDEMVICNNIQFTSMCEHHMLPFTGVAHVGYIPQGKIVGLSKLSRLVEHYSKRLQVQERLTNEIGHGLFKGADALGAGCVIKARHSCMSCRGVNKPTANMVTSGMYGVFRDDIKVREEFLRLIGI